MDRVSEVVTPDKPALVEDELGQALADAIIRATGGAPPYLVATVRGFREMATEPSVADEDLVAVYRNQKAGL